MSNLGIIDRVVRTAVGVAFILAPLAAGWPSLVLGLSLIVGVVLVATAAISFCPIYALLGLTSKRRPLGRT